MTTNPIENACRLLREGAAELKNCHTLAAMGHDWTGEPEAKAAYDEHMATADALERLHLEHETLRTGYAAARLEIESLQRRVQEVGAAARREHERADRAMRAAQPAEATRCAATLKAQNDQFEHALAELVDLVCPGLDSGNLLVDAKTAGDAAQALRASHGQAPAQVAPADTEVLDVLRAFAEGRINHINEGLCPDSITGPNFRDPDCRVCRALDGAAPAAVAGPSDAEPLHITHGPLMRHAAYLLRSRKPTLPEHESVAAELELAADGHPTPSGEPSEEWLEVARIATAPTTHPAPQQEPTSVDLKTMELAESVGLIGPASRAHDLHAAIQRFHDLICANATINAAQMAAEAISEAVPQPSPVAQGDALDAARYQWLRDSTEWEPFDSAWLVKHDIYGCPTLAMDVAIDAARAAQEGK